MTSISDLRSEAQQILVENDLGDYTVPTKGLYPFQWNWDSCLSALGLFRLDESRGWLEIETLFSHQWDDGMVPHIIFHRPDSNYFPGPDEWETGRAVPTSGITQPAVSGFAVRRLYERATDSDLARSKIKKLLPMIFDWHEWFFGCRDIDDRGLVSIIHPWESGRDNSVDWDIPLSRVPTDGATFSRRDTSHTDSSHRPTDDQYVRYMWLVRHFRSCGWRDLASSSPFCVIDPCFNALLLRSCSDLAFLADEFGETEIAERSRSRLISGIEALENLWSDTYKRYLCLDCSTNELLPGHSIGGLVPLILDIPVSRSSVILSHLESLSNSCRYLIPSHDIDSPDFDSVRYWRGPSWLIMNMFMIDGLRRVGQESLVNRVCRSSLELVERHGFSEYYDPLTGLPCGGSRFTWTASMVYEFLDELGLD